MSEYSDLIIKEEPNPIQQYICEENTIFLVENHSPPTSLFNCMAKNAPEMYTCTNCGFKVYLKVNLKVHMELVHKAGLEVTLESFCSFSETNFNLSNILRFYNCKDCGFQTFSRLVLLKHSLQHSKKDDQCEQPVQVRSFKSRSHVNNNHVPVKKTELFDCLECHWKSTCKYQMKKHILMKHTPANDMEWFKCGQCSFKTQYKGNLKKHKIRHTSSKDMRWYQCDFCPHKAKQKNHLKIHVTAKHTANDNIKWFNCDHCTYKAKDKSTLKGHLIAKHTAPEDIKWIQCHLCTYKCKRKTHLKQHLQGKHTAPEDINWIRCEFCSYKCKRTTYLKQHLRCKHKMEV